MLSSYLLAVALFLAVAGVAVVPTVGNTHRPTTLVHSKHLSHASATPLPRSTTTVDPRQDTRLTEPPPADLGSLVVNLSDLGFVRLVDSRDAGPFDLAGAVANYPSAQEKEIRTAFLRRFGFTRGYRADFRAAAGTPIVEIEIFEYRTIAGAEDDLTSLAAGSTQSAGETRVVVTQPAGAFAIRHDSTDEAPVMHLLTVFVQRGARVYEVIVGSSSVVPAPQLAAEIAARQAAAP